MTSYGDIKSGEATLPADHGLALDAIQIDGGTQSRASLNQTVVDEYAGAIKDGATFPPIVVFYDGDKHWLADGFHRFHAYRQLGRAGTDADIRQGTRRDAILHSVGANETHGLRRTREDKRRAVLTLLSDPEWSAWTDREIAKACLVDHKTVSEVRAELTGEIPSERTYTTKHGTVATMKTAGINASRQTNAPRPSINDEPSPEVGPQAEAFLAGTGTGMPADREGRHEGEAASVDLPTISDEDREFRDLQMAWDFARDCARARFLTRNDLTESNPATGLGGSDVDRSAERASSAVKVGATNSSGESRERQKVGSPISKPEAPSMDGARKGPLGTAAIDSSSDGDGNAHTVSPSPSEAVANPRAPRPSATAKVSSSVPPPPPGETEKAGEAAPPPAASPASQFENPRCQHPETCHLVHSRQECFDCTMAWAKRPRDEQIRLWAEANEASA